MNGFKPASVDKKLRRCVSASSGKACSQKRNGGMVEQGNGVMAGWWIGSIGRWLGSKFTLYQLG